MTAIPFMADEEQQPKLSGARIVEAVVISLVVAVLSALGASYLTVSNLRIEIDSLKDDVSDVRGDVRELRSVIYDRPSWERERRTVRAGPDGVSIGTRQED